MAHSFVDCWRGRQRRCGGNVVTVQTTLLVLLFLAAGVLLLDSYKWRRFSRFSRLSGGPYAGVTERQESSPPSTAKETLQPDDGKTTASPPSFAAVRGSSPPSEIESKTMTTQGSPLPVEMESQPMPKTPEVPLDKVAYPPPPSAQIVKKRPIPVTPLDKLEYSLAQARLLIRLAAKNDSNTKMEGPQGYEPYGDAYRSAAAFRQSFREMERRFRVYVYAEGEEPLVHTGPCKEIYAVEGRFIQELQGNRNPFVTPDPDKASVFFLPFSVAMMVTYLYEKESRSMDPLRLFVWDYVDVLSEKYAFWNRSGGADHFMLSCHDWGPAISKSNKGLDERSIRVLCNANTSEGYVPWKDASLPEINLVGGRVPAELGGPSAKDRPHLAFFAGRDHGPVRPQLFKHWEGKDEDIMVYQWLPKHLNYHQLMKKSRFCICPGGYEVNSPRIVEAIYNECVPVIIADGFVLPFSDILNWDAFSLHIKESDIPNLKHILQNITMERYTSMQQKVGQVQRHFLFHQPPQRYDVFHMILHSVWLRRLNIRVGYS